MSLKLQEPYPAVIGSNYSVLSHSDTTSDTDSLEHTSDSNNSSLEKMIDTAHEIIIHKLETETKNKPDETLQEGTIKKTDPCITSATTIIITKADDAVENGLDETNGEKDTDEDSIETIVPESGLLKELLIPALTTKLNRIPKSNTFDSSVLYHANIKQHNCLNVEPIRQVNRPRFQPFMTSQEYMVTHGSKQPRSTISSKLRAEKQKEKQEQVQENGDEYQTPSQRKDLLIRDLRRQVRELTTNVEEKDHDIALYKQHMDAETYQLIQEKDDTIIRLREELRNLKQSYDDLSAFCDESITAASAIEQKAETLKQELTDIEKHQQKIYLEMYRKGQNSARFEREEELERLASSGACTVTISELVKKLALTELELAKWQTIRTQESYSEGLQPETEADATLRFLKDAFFHYITDTREFEPHIRAIIKIFRYTAPQMEKINASKLIARMDKKHKNKTPHK